MLRVPLPLWGVAVGLFTASSVFGETPEPPADFPFEPPEAAAPDLIHQSSAELHNPLLTMMVDGVLTSLQSGNPPDSATRLKPTPQTKSATTPSTQPGPANTLTDGFCDCEVGFPSAPCFLPYAYPQQQPSCGHKCHRRQRGSCFGGQGQGCGNAYGPWGYGMGGCGSCFGGQPYGNQGCTCRRCQRKHGCGQQGCGYGNAGWGGGWGGWGMSNYDGYMDGGFGCGFCGYYAPAQPPCHGHKCRHNRGCGCNNTGYGGYGGYGNPYWGGGYSGFGGCGGCVPPPPPQSLGHKCHRKQGCWANAGYPGWPAYPVPGANQWDDGYGAFTDPNCYGGCSKHCCPCCKHGHHCFGHFNHSCFSHFRHTHCGHYRTPQYPAAAYPMTMPCFACEEFCSDCSFAAELPPAASPAPSKSK